MNSLVRCTVVFTAVVFAWRASAQTSAIPGGSSSGLSAADAEWNSAKAETRAVTPQLALGASKAAAVASRQQYLQKASQLRDFKLRNPRHASAKEATRLETLMLLYAGYAGDTTQDARRAALVASLRSDASIDAKARAEIAACAGSLEIARRTDLSEKAKMAAYEELERRLKLEFPAAFPRGNPRKAPPGH